MSTEQHASDALSRSQERDVAYHLHPFTNLKTHQSKGPLIIDRGEGVYLVDSTGRRYLDGMASLWCCALGYHEPRLIEAAHRQMQRLPYSHTFRGRSHETLIELAEKLVAIAPGRMSKAFFANSGSEATDTAVKIAWYYNHALGRPGKRKIIARRGGYHGSTIAAASLSGHDYLHRSFNLPLECILFADCPHHYRYAHGGEDEETFASRLAEGLEALIVREGPETVAAFIAEPVMGVGGVIVPPRTYFEKIQRVLTKYDILLIADEVICGFGRTGNMFGSMTFGIEPDMVIVAKSLSSAYFPISGLIVSGAIYDAMAEESGNIGVFGHGLTYSGHPVGAAVALETLKLYEERSILEHVRRVSPTFQRRLRAFAERPFVGEVRGVGLMGAIELVSNKATKERFPAEQRVGERVADVAEREQLFVRPIGDSIVMAPPLVIEDDVLHDLFDRLERAFDSVEQTLSD